MSGTKKKEEVVQVEAVETVERPYTLRKFKDSDLFPLLQILKKVGIKDFKDAFFQMASGEKTAEAVGFDVIFDMAEVLIGNMEKVQNEVYTLYADMSGIPQEELREMEFGTIPLMIMDSFSEVKNTAFFKVLSKFLK